MIREKTRGNNGHFPGFFFNREINKSDIDCFLVTKTTDGSARKITLRRRILK